MSDSATELRPLVLSFERNGEEAVVISLNWSRAIDLRDALDEYLTR